MRFIDVLRTAAKIADEYERSCQGVGRKEYYRAGCYSFRFFPLRFAGLLSQLRPCFIYDFIWILEGWIEIGYYHYNYAVEFHLYEFCLFERSLSYEIFH